MSQLPFNPVVQSAGVPELDLSRDELVAREARRAKLQRQAQDIVAIATLQSHSALNCLHKINVAGGTTEKAYGAVNQRIIDDQDAHGAYHAIAMAQTTPDLPFDVPVLLDIVVAHGDGDLQLRTLKLFDSQPVNAAPITRIEQAILAAGDKPTIDALQAHLAGRSAV